MEGKQNISDYRKLLDTSLASHTLSAKESIRKLVQNQLHASPSEVHEKRDTDLLDFVKLLRSASGLDFKESKENGAPPGAWKLHQEKKNYRVLYREGPHGSPFHTILAEGYANASVDTCLCAGWEVSTYIKWWPHSDFPPFKVITSCCLKKVRIDEHISLIRLKLPWPIRELVLNYFVLEIPEEGLLIVLVNSISDTETVHEHKQGFLKDQVPKTNGTIRMDWTGGFAIKRITANTSYLRFVGNLDAKLEFVPQSFINFIARQLVGGCCKLFRKKVESETRVNGDLKKALEGPLYVRAREHLSLTNGVGPKHHQCEESENHNVHTGTST